jgi:hypothetical protein
MIKPKRKRTAKPVKVPVAPLNDGMDTPVPDHGAPIVLSAEETALFKQANNTLGDPHKI